MTSDSSNSQKLKVAILGCGWLGRGLFEKWNQNHDSIEPILFSRTPAPDVYHLELKADLETLPGLLQDCSTIIYTLPPSKDFKGYLQTLETFVHLLKPHKKLILISTTSVFENNKGLCDEQTFPMATSERNLTLIKAEKCVLDYSDKSTVLRSGGQYGNGRYPAKFIAHLDGLKNSLQPVNVIHHEDLCRICTYVVQNECPSIVHAVSPEHPSKEDFYNNQAQSLGLKLPKGDGLGSHGKVVEPTFLKKINFDFKKKSSFM